MTQPWPLKLHSSRGSMPYACFIFFIISLCSTTLLAQSTSSSVVSERDQESPPSREKSRSTAYDQAMILLYSGKPHEAQALLESDLEKTGDERTLFGLGWIHYYHARHKEAEKVFSFILNGEPKPLRKAACLQVLGLIYLRTGRYEQSLKSLDKAQVIYEEHQEHSELMKIHIAHIELFLTTKEPEKADMYFHKSLYDTTRYNKRYPVNIGYLYSLKARQEFLRGNYDGALSFAHLSLENQGEDEAGKISAYIDMAFYQILSGDLALGEKYNNEALAIGKRMNLPSHVAPAGINLMLLKKCRGLDYQKELVSMYQFLDISHEKSIEDALEFVKSWECEQP